MSKDNKYCNFLLNETKKGRNNCYIDLCFIGLRNIFSLVFELVPIREEAIKISSEVFLVAWRNIQKIQNLGEFKKLIDKIIILRCIDYLSKNSIELLDDDAIAKLSNELKSPFSVIDKEILKLRTIERVVIVLCDQIGLKAEIVNRIYKGINLEEIEYTLNKVRQKLIKKFPPKKNSKFSDEQWNEIDFYIRTTETVNTQDVDNNQAELVAEYLEYSKELMNNLFRNLEPDNLIIENLKNYILKEKSSKKLDKKISVDEKDVLKTEKLLNKEEQKEKFKYAKNEATLLSTVFKSKNIIKIAITIVIAITMAVALFMIMNRPASWIISSDVVFTIVNGTNAKTNILKESDIITTANNKGTKINSELASIEIFEKSEFVISKITSSENIFELKSGSVKFISIAGSTEDFQEADIEYKIKTPLSTIVTENSNFVYSKSKLNGFNLAVERGRLNLEITRSNRMVYCVGNYNLKYKDSYSLAVPYYTKSSKDFVNAIDRISKLPTDNNAFNFILNNAEDNDILTLWHLLSISDIQKKKLVLEKLNVMLMLEISVESAEGVFLSEEVKLDLLDFIEADLLIRSDK